MTTHDPLKPNAVVRAGDVTFANNAPISVLAGPCQMESRTHALEMASALKEIADKIGIDFDRIIVRQGDTADLPVGGGTGGSRSIPIASKSSRLRFLK